MVPLAPKLKVMITYHFISYRRKSVLNLLIEIQNTVRSKVRSSDKERIDL